jgi:hypothetical protein
MADDRDILLYDTGHAHVIVRGIAAGIAFIAGGAFLDTLAMSLSHVSLLHTQYPMGRLIALIGTLALSWFCILCVIGRNRIVFDPTADHVILRGPGLAFRQRDICYDVSRITAVAVRHVHTGIGIQGWNVGLALADSRRRWLTRFDESDEAEARELAEKIGEMIKKPVE